MPRKKKNAIRISLKLDKAIAETLQDISKKTGLNRTELIEISLKAFLTNWEPYLQNAFDERTIDKEK